MIVALAAVGALLVSVVLVVPAATVRLVARDLRTLQLGTGALAAVEGVAALWLADGLNVSPGPAMAVLGGAVFALVAVARARARVSAPLVARRRGPRRRLPAGRRRAHRRHASPPRPARSSRSSAPTAAARARCSARCSGELPHRRGTVELAGRPAYVPQTERARLDFPVSALDVALMGAYGRTPWFRRLARADRAAARAALARVGLEAEAGERFGALSGGQRQRVLIARALVQDAPVLLLDEPLSGVDAPSAARIEALFEELRGEGRALLVATHDVRQARAWQRVLCLNRAPDRLRRARPTVLTPDVLQATYGAELVVLGDGSTAVAVEHHEH